MNDRELLEKAAKAVKLKIEKSPYNGGGRNNDGFDIFGNAVLDWHNNKKWNPLTDDGDALRLAVKLGLDIDNAYDSIEVKQYSFEKEKFILSVLEDNRNDPYAATRRAIVRAAAEIGKEMK